MKKTHPNLYSTYMLYALLSIALGLNFLFLNPAFTPLSIPKWAIGTAFLGCGLFKLVLLLLVSSRERRNNAGHTRLLRFSMGLSVAIMSFWAMVLTFDFFRLSQTSLQLPLTFVGLAMLGFMLLTEPFINPATEK